MKYICIFFSLFSLFSYSQNSGEEVFEKYINYTSVVFKIPEGFEQVQLAKSESFVSHPNLHSTLIINKIFNAEKNVQIGFEVLPFEMEGKQVYKGSEISNCILLDDYDVSQGGVLMYGDHSPKNYNVDLHANYPVRLFSKYNKKYDFCRKIYLQNNKKGRVIVLFFYNEEQRDYVLKLSQQFYKYLRFKD